MGYTLYIQIFIYFLFFYWHYISVQGQWTRHGLSLLLHHAGSAVLFSQALPVLFLQVSTWLTKHLCCSFAQFLTNPWGAVFTFCTAFTFYLCKRGVLASILFSTLMGLILELPTQPFLHSCISINLQNTWNNDVLYISED